MSKLCHEPRAALAVLLELLAPHLSTGRVRILQPCAPMTAELDGDRVRSITVRSGFGPPVTLVAPYFVDATETGDLLPITRTEYVTGSEARRDTGEPHAADVRTRGTIRRSPSVSPWTTSTARTTSATSPRGTAAGATTSRG